MSPTPRRPVAHGATGHGPAGGSGPSREPGRDGPQNSSLTGRTRRDRRGRGLRGSLLPAGVPGFRSRSELFDQIVLDAVADLEDRWPEQLTSIEFAVDDVPPAGAATANEADDPDDNLVDDDGVVLTRFYPPGVDRAGKPTKPRIVIYRRPLEFRAGGQSELTDLVTEVLAEQLRSILGG